MTIDARLDAGLPSHPKTKKLIRRLGPQGGWYLVCLILWTRVHRPDGNLAGMSVEDIELAIDWTGEHGSLVRELVSVGFLDETDDGFALHDWETHQPWSTGAADRSERSKWAALCKRHGRSEAARRMPEYAQRLLAAEENHASGTGTAAASSENPAASTECAAASSENPASGMRPASTPHATGRQLALDALLTGENGSAPLPSPLPSPSPKERASAPAVPSRALPDPPDWMPADSWAGFVESRKKAKHPLTPRAADLITKKLLQLWQEGHEPAEVLDQSTRNGWRDVFPVRESRQGAVNGIQQQARRLREL